MNPAAEPLRARVAAVPQQGPGGRRYGAELKRAVVEHAFARQSEGALIREISEELGLSTGLLGKWLRHARLRLKSGKVPFTRSDPPLMPKLAPHGPTTESSAVGSPPGIPSGSRAPAARRGARRRQAAIQRPIVIPATTLAEFLAGAVVRYGSIRRAATGIAVPYSTLRGWLRGRYGDAGDRGVRAPMP
jgi:transposase-like protein